jgi:(p)ppGpp synthase/HD superfamily hydrolase
MVNLIGDASDFAVKRHGEQKYGRKPYHVHLLDVVNVQKRFHDWSELTQELIDASWLHDTIEDTDVTYGDILFSFNRKTADLVFAVSNEEGKTRKERHIRVYSKIRGTEQAIILKLADRIANIEQSISYGRIGRKPHKLFSMYLKEWEGFQKALRGRCAGESYIARAMWEHLDELFIIGKENLVSE